MKVVSKLSVPQVVSGLPAPVPRITHRLTSLVSHKGTLTLFDQGAVSMTGFLTSVIIGRFAGKDELGLYMLALSISVFITELQTAIISTPYMIRRPQLGDQREQRSYRGSVIAHQIAFSAGTVLLVSLAWMFLSLQGTMTDFHATLLVLAGAISLVMLRDFVRRLCFAELRTMSALLFDVAAGTLQVGGLLYFALGATLSANLALATIGMASAVSLLCWFAANRGEFELSARALVADFFINWQLGKWILASGLLWALSMNFYPWLITYFHGTESTGLWAACIGILGVLNAPLIGLQNYLGPKIATVYATHGVSALCDYSRRAALFLVAFLGSVSVALALAGDWLLQNLYGTDYAGNGLALAFLALGLVAASVGFVYSRGLFALGKSDVDFKINIVPLLVLATAGVWLVQLSGTVGAAASLFVAHVASALARYWCLKAATTERSEIAIEPTVELQTDE
ncbi:MAG: lipopolysaccharide biosynthesis protein [Bdellovibrionales bacterium]|nr:lipopolysaccharide biosynthesis protein [Bdellovibrionales bacterium]